MGLPTDRPCPYLFVEAPDHEVVIDFAPDPKTKVEITVRININRATSELEIEAKADREGDYLCTILTDTTHSFKEI